MSALWSVVEIVEDPILTLVEAFSPAATVVAGPTPAGVSVVEIVETGPTGPAGPSGSGASYEHVQAVAAATWIVNHPLTNAHPLVEVLDSSGFLVVADVEWVTPTQVAVYHAAPLAGSALLT